MAEDLEAEGGKETIDALREELRLEAIKLDEEKTQLTQEMETLKQFLAPYSTKGVDDEGFPDSAYPHFEVAYAKYRLGEIRQLLDDLDALVQKKLSLYFSLGQ